jgi:hypothetical protein
MLLREIKRQEKLGKDVALRASGAFAEPEIYDALGVRGVKHAIRIPANDSLDAPLAHHNE